MDIAGWRERWRFREMALEAQDRDNDELKGIFADMPTLAPDFQRHGWTGSVRRAGRSGSAPLP